MLTRNASKIAMFTTLGLAGVLLGACGGKPRYIEVEATKEARKGIVETAVIEHAKTAAVAATPVVSGTAKIAPVAPPAKPWLGVTASRGKHEVVAAWSKTDVVLSSDGGKSFHKVLGGPGLVDKVAIDARGTAFAIRHVDELGVRDTDGATKWRAMPFVKKTTSLTTGAGVVAWLGMRKLPGGETQEALALSKDQGDTWTFPAMPSLGDFANDVIIEDDGTIRVMTASEADCGGGFQARFVGKISGGDFKEVPWPIDAPGNVGLGANGWAYGVGDCGGENHLCASGADGNAVAVAPVQQKTWKSLRLVTDGKVAWGILDGQLAYLSAATVMFPAVGTPSHFVVTGIDAEGQPIGLANGKALRWTRAGKWQPLFAATPGIS